MVPATILWKSDKEHLLCDLGDGNMIVTPHKGQPSMSEAFMSPGTPAHLLEQQLRDLKAAEAATVNAVLC